MIWLAQAIGLLGFAAHLLSFQQSRRGRLLVLYVVGAIFWTIHFILLGFYTAAAMNAIAALRSYVFYKYKKRDNNLLVYIFMAVLVVVTAFTWQGYISLLPLIASLISTYASWAESAQKIRWLTLPAPIAWFTHNIQVGSIGAVADTTVFVSILIGLFRHKDTQEKTDTTKKSS